MAERALKAATAILQIADGYVFAGITSSYGAGNEDVWLLKTNGERRQPLEQRLSAARRGIALTLFRERRTAATSSPEGRIPTERDKGMSDSREDQLER